MTGLKAMILYICFPKTVCARAITESGLLACNNGELIKGCLLAILVYSSPNRLINCVDIFLQEDTLEAI